MFFGGILRFRHFHGPFAGSRIIGDPTLNDCAYARTRLPNFLVHRVSDLVNLAQTMAPETYQSRLRSAFSLPSHRCVAASRREWRLPLAKRPGRSILPPQQPPKLKDFQRDGIRVLHRRSIDNSSLAAADYGPKLKVSGCCERGNCQNCSARNCTHFCHLSGR